MAKYDFTHVVNEMALQESIEDCKLETQFATGKGDGYLGTVQTVRLAGTNKIVDVVFKYSPRDPHLHELIPLHDTYMAEIYFYKNIATAFEDFQKEYNIKEPFNNIPKYYLSVEETLNELIVLENLKNDDYDVWDRLRWMNRSHLEITLNVFAKFHGISLAMKHLKPKLFNELADEMNNYGIWWKCLKAGTFYKQIGGMVKEILDIFDPITEKHYRDKFEHFGQTVGKLVDSALRIPDPYDVIQQGDCWCNNAMYQYNDQNHEIPNNVKLLDFQMARKGPLSADLAHFFYTIAPEDSIDNLDYFMKFYHRAMGIYLEGFGLIIEDIFPFEVFLKQWQRSAVHGLMLTINVCKMMHVEPEDAPDLINDLTTFMSTLRLDKDKETAYRRRIKHIFMHFVDRNFI